MKTKIAAIVGTAAEVALAPIRRFKSNQPIVNIYREDAINDIVESYLKWTVTASAKLPREQFEQENHAYLNSIIAVISK